MTLGKLLGDVIEMAALFTGRAVVARNNVIVKQYKLSDMAVGCGLAKQLFVRALQLLTWFPVGHQRAFQIRKGRWFGKLLSQLSQLTAC
jgi:hypothetical protein